MTEDAETYRYFADPHNFSSYSAVPRECGLCGEQAGGYMGPFAGEEEITFVCAGCLQSGALEEEDVASNSNGDIEALWEQQKFLNPGGSQQEIAAHVEERIQELAERTPPLLVDNFVLWPAHCGDFTRFEKEVGQDEVVRLAGDESPAAWLKTHLSVHNLVEGNEEILNRLPARPVTHPSNSPIRALLFTCLVCTEPVVVIDGRAE